MSEHRPVIPPRWRNYLYPVAVAIIAVLGSYGLIEGSQVAVWVALVAALLGTGTAAAYRPSKTLGAPERDTAHE